MTKGMHDKTIEWEFVESMEQPKIVNAAAGHLGTKDNSYAQFTVRFHTLQVSQTANTGMSRTI